MIVSGKGLTLTDKRIKGFPQLLLTEITIYFEILADQTSTKKKNRGGAYSNLGFSSKIKEGRGSNLSEWPIENLLTIFFNCLAPFLNWRGVF